MGKLNDFLYEVGSLLHQKTEQETRNYIAVKLQLYTPVCYEDHDNGMWLCYVRELPGLMVVESSYEEAIKACEVRELEWLDITAKEGGFIPNPRTPEVVDYWILKGKELNQAFELVSVV
jgi:predicted RNase H-like HicB family nuclease